MAKQELNTAEINKILLATDYDKITVWNMLEEKANVFQVQKLWRWATKELETEEIKSILLFHSD